MSAEEIRALLNMPTQRSSSSSSSKQDNAAAAAAAAAAGGRPIATPKPASSTPRQQQQGSPVFPTSSSSSRSPSPGANASRLRAAARQLGQLSPELASEWYDRALRQGLAQGFIPSGVDQDYLSGFLAREIDKAAARAAAAPSNSSSGAALLLGVVSQYGGLLGVDHLALLLHRLAQLQEEGCAGPEEVGRVGLVLVLSPVTLSLLLLSVMRAFARHCVA
jgi:hypothetical protein